MPQTVCKPGTANSEGTLGTENDRAVLACDGVWDVLSPETVIEAARQYEDPKKASENILQMAKDAGSIDNITVIVLDLRHYTAGLNNKKMKITAIHDRAEKFNYISLFFYYL